MSHESLKKLKRGSVLLAKSVSDYSLAASKLAAATVGGAVVGATLGGTAGLSGGLVCTALCGGGDMGVTPIALGVTYMAVGARTGARMGLELVENSAMNDVQRGAVKLTRGLNELLEARRLAPLEFHAFLSRQAENTEYATDTPRAGMNP